MEAHAVRREPLPAQRASIGHPAKIGFLAHFLNMQGVEAHMEKRRTMTVLLYSTGEAGERLQTVIRDLVPEEKLEV